MKAIVYVSKASIPFDVPDLLELARLASECNSDLGITGYLWFNKGQFIQYIEGEAEALDALMERIKKDDRHQVLNHTTDSEVVTRRFPSWSMRYLREEDFVEISLENILADQLLLMRPSAFQMKDWDRQIWGTIESLSSLQERMQMKTA